MMKSCWLLLVGMLWALAAGAQTPLGINYQGVARAADGTPLSSRSIGLRISITNGPSGSIEYEEEQHPTTNEFGLFAIVIGQGQSSGSLADVDWSTGNKWLQIELDPDDNGNYNLVGSQQLMSVPYALYARNAGNGLDPGFGIDISNGKINNILPDQVITLTGTGATTVSGTYPNFTVNSTDAVDDADANPTNELQTISKTGSTVTLSNGGGSFTDAVDDADNDPTNEIQDLTSTATGTNRTINISGGGTGTTIDVADNDNNSSNELQTISKTGSTVTLSNGGGSFTDAVDDADADPANEYNTAGSFIANNTIRITDGGSDIDIPIGPLNAALDAGGQNITNLADPVNPQDAVNRQYLEQVDANDYAINIAITYTSAGAGDVALDLSGASLDKGGLITGSTINISEAGIYAFSISGFTSSSANIDIVIDGINYPVLFNNNPRQYMGTYLFELSSGNQVQLIGRFTDTNGETINLQVAIYKI